MNGSKFTESQLEFALKQVETETCLEEVFTKYGELGVSELKRLQSLDQENVQLKKLVAELS